MSQKNLGSDNRKRIHLFLQKYADGKYSNSGIEFDYDSGEFLVLINSSAGSVTRRSMRMMERRIKTILGLEATVRALIGGIDEPLTAIVSALAEQKLKKSLADVVVAVTSERIVDMVLVINNVDAIPSDQDRELIRHQFKSLLRPLGLKLGDLCYSILNDDAPSEFQIIRRLYVLAPVSPDILFDQLCSKGYDSPSLGWLKRQLDELRRKGPIQWQDDLGYTLTEKGLSALPRLVHRNSPDIERALALARRCRVDYGSRGGE